MRSNRTKTALVDRPTKSSEYSHLFLRLWEGPKLTPTLARHVLQLKFDAEDLDRMHELAKKNSSGIIKAKELEELDSYLQVGLVLSTLQSRARKVL